MTATPTAADFLERAAVYLSGAMRDMRIPLARDDVVAGAVELERIARRLTILATPPINEPPSVDPRARAQSGLLDALRRTTKELGETRHAIAPDEPPASQHPTVLGLQVATYELGAACDLIATHFDTGTPRTVDGERIASETGQWDLTIAVSRAAWMTAQLTYDVAMKMATIEREAIPSAGRLLAIRPELATACSAVDVLLTMDAKAAEGATLDTPLAARGVLLRPRDGESPRDLLDNAAVIARSLRDTAYRAAEMWRPGPHSASALRTEAGTFAMTFQETARVLHELDQEPAAVALEDMAKRWSHVRAGWHELRTVPDLGDRHPIVQQCFFLRARIFRVLRDEPSWSRGWPDPKPRPTAEIAPAFGGAAGLVDSLSKVVNPMLETREHYVTVVERLSAMNELLIPTSKARRSPDVAARWIPDDSARSIWMLQHLLDAPDVSLDANVIDAVRRREAALPTREHAAPALGGPDR